MVRTKVSSLIDDLFKILMVRIKVNHIFLFVKKHTETAQDTDSLVGVQIYKYSEKHSFYVYLAKMDSTTP